MLKYNPYDRIKLVEALYHPFFEEIKEANCKLPEGKDVDPRVFQFNSDELGDIKYRQKIIPDHYLNNSNVNWNINNILKL